MRDILLYYNEENLPAFPLCDWHPARARDISGLKASAPGLCKSLAGSEIMTNVTEDKEYTKGKINCRTELE